MGFSTKKAVTISGVIMLGVAALVLVISQVVSITVTQELVPADPLWIAIDDNAPLSNIKSILDADSSVAAKPFASGEFPIEHAVTAKRPDIVRLLLERGADPNVAGPLGSPLAIAALHNDVKTGRVLLEHGADPRLPGLLGITVAQICDDDEHREFRELLENHDSNGDEP